MNLSDRQLLTAIFGCIDNTSLNSPDSPASIAAFCQHSLSLSLPNSPNPHVASVCVYPSLVPAAVKALQGSDISVASVAAAFPSAQAPLSSKLLEVQYALDNGADEIDIVLSLGLFLAGELSQVSDEIASIKDLCGSHVLKVILETSALPSPDLISKASDLAIAAGADFLKTSTGKIPGGATPEAAELMLKSIKNYYQKTKKLVGFKASGGISSPEQALLYASLAQNILGPQYIDKHYFRIGASRLTNSLFDFLTK